MKRVLIILAILLASTGAWAKSLYVSTTGSDSVTYANNSISQPWATWAKARSGALAGDTVIFRGGTYTVSSAVTGGATGSASSPVTYTNYPGETVTTNITSETGFVVDKPYHYYVADAPGRMIFHGNSSADHLFYNGENADGNHFKIQYCNLILESIDAGRNAACIRLQSNRSNYALILNNDFYGPTNSSKYGNAAVIYLGGGNQYTKILGNHVHHFGLGIYVKHKNGDTSTANAEIAYNWIYDTIHGIYGVPQRINIHDNILHCSDYPIALGDNGGGTSGGYNLINHNTGFNGGYMSKVQDRQCNVGNTLTNNIWRGRVYYNEYGTGSIPHGALPDYNMYPNIDQPVKEYSTLYSFSGWQTHLGGSPCTGDSHDCHSQAATPTFVGGASPTQVSHYALASGSAGENDGSDGEDLGADVTLVGIDPSGECSEPTASYTENDTSISEGGTVNFANSSTGATSYVWHFGDGATSTSTSPSHDYDSAGSFQPYLEAINSCGSDIYYGNLITVTPAQLPTPAITVTASGLDVTVEGTATNGPITSWDWDWGDSTTHGNTQNATHTYATEGGKTITLTVTNAEGQGSVSKSVTLYETTVLPDTPALESVQIGTQTYGASVIWHDEFEDSDLETKYWDYNAGSGTPFAQTTDIAFGGSTGSAKGTWTAGQVDAGSCAYHFGRNPVASQTQTDQDFDEIYIRFYMRLSPAWSGQPVKLARVTSFAASSWAQSMADHLWGNAGYLSIDQDPVTGVSGSTLLTTKWNDTSHFTWLGVSRGDADVYDGSYNGRWVCVEHRTKLNTSGNSDGISQTWIDGVLDNSQTNLNFIGSWTGYGINVVRLENYWNQGSAKAQSRYIDNFVISTSAIGFATSPVNPYIYKGNFSSSAEGVTQASMTVQISTSAGTGDMVWQGSQSGTGNSCLVNSTTGTFEGDLLGRSSLAHSTTYYARVKVTDSADNDSAWSAWVPFKTQAQVSTSKKASGGVSLSGGASF